MLFVLSIFLLAIIAVVFFLLGPKSKETINTFTPLSALLSIQILLTAISVYILLTAEGFDGMMVIFTAVPALVLAPIIFLKGIHALRLGHKSPTVWVATLLNAFLAIALVLIFVTQYLFYPE